MPFLHLIVHLWCSCTLTACLLWNRCLWFSYLWRVIMRRVECEKAALAHFSSECEESKLLMLCVCLWYFGLLGIYEVRNSSEGKYSPNIMRTANRLWISRTHNIHMVEMTLSIHSLRVFFIFIQSRALVLRGWLLLKEPLAWDEKIFTYFHHNKCESMNNGYMWL